MRPPSQPARRWRRPWSPGHGAARLVDHAQMAVLGMGLDSHLCMINAADTSFACTCAHIAQ